MINNIQEAIQHCKDVANSKVCEDCKQDHLQLAKWLEELQDYKNKYDK